MIDLLDEEAETVGSALEFIYNGEYFPKRVGDGKDGVLETDPSIPSVDSDGEQLLKHARIYTLAEKLRMPVSNILRPVDWLRRHEAAYN